VIGLALLTQKCKRQLYTEAGAAIQFYATRILAVGPIKLRTDRCWKKKLDALFSTNTKKQQEKQSDITSRIGRVHGNEPNYHIAPPLNSPQNSPRKHKIVHKYKQNFIKYA
jgi:hypothetical protein